MCLCVSLPAGVVEAVAIDVIAVEANDVEVIPEL